MGKTVLVVLTLFVAAVLVALGGVAYVYSGEYNVAATEPHSAFEQWLLGTTMEHSVRAHARREVAAAPTLGEESFHHGAKHYVSTCVGCHGAPGVERGEFGKGLTPSPPQLAKAVTRWNQQELFWIVKNGIKLAGMPAFGPTHTDEEIWAMVAFLRRLPQMSAQEYRQIAARVEKDAEGHSR